MSVFLSWENPEDAMDPKAYRVRVCRVTPSGGKLFTISESSTWGFIEDKGTNDPTSTYDIAYLDKAGRTQFRITIDDIVVWERPDNVCVITYKATDWSGKPAVAKIMEVSDEPDGGSLYYRFLTNIDGQIQFVAKYGSRILIRIDGSMKALDVVIPEQPEIDWDTLIMNGSWVDTDRRGWY